MQNFVLMFTFTILDLFCKFGLKSNLAFWCCLINLPVFQSQRLEAKGFLCFTLNRHFIEEGNPAEKVVIVEEKLNGADIDDIGNLENLPRFVFIDEEYGNLKVVEILLEILTKRRSQTFHDSLLMLTL